MTNPIPTPIPNPQSPTPEPRIRTNRANATLSTGPRTAAGKQRSSRNAVTHGLRKPTDPDRRFPGTEMQERSKGVPATCRSPVIASEDPAAYQRHCRQFFDEYQPATPTETHLTQELADTAWRMNRIPLLEAALLHRAANPPSQQAAIDFDIVDAHRALATLGVHSQRLSRQFQKSLHALREIQSDRALHERRQLKDAAALLEFHKHKGTPWQPADHGFVFSKDHVERFAQRMQDLNQSRHIEHVLFHMQPPIQPRTPARPALL